MNRSSRFVTFIWTVFNSPNHSRQRIAFNAVCTAQSIEIVLQIQLIVDSPIRKLYFCMRHSKQVKKLTHFFAMSGECVVLSVIKEKSDNI